VVAEIHGNTRGLAPSELRAIKKLLQRRVGPEEIVSLDLAREVFALAEKLRRRIGVLLSREGDVKEVCVGTKDILYLPDLGRYRLGEGRLRRLRLVFSDISSHDEPFIPSDIYTDLEKLRLDMVVAIRGAGKSTSAAYAYIIPSKQSDQRSVHTEQVPDVSRLDRDFTELMFDVESELAQGETVRKKTGGLGAVLVGVHPKGDRTTESSMDELAELARTAGVKILDRVLQRRDPDPRTLLGKGKIEEVVLRCLRLGADLVIFDNELRPSQWRAITNATELKVIDRSMLILDIFAGRAQSSEGRLQVELAQLKYNMPRLVEKDAGLSRLTGGIGGRGPGETVLEIGRRRIRDRIFDLEKRIDAISGQRRLRRKRREEREIPLVSILGYTNVGKSTLFNALSGSRVLAENKLFATLDPAQRQVVVPSNILGDSDPSGGRGVQLVLSDTVGFIRRLPEALKNAFRATLEELDGATLLIHVIDASDPEVHERKEAVQKILGEMELAGIPQIVVANKIDATDSDTSAALEREYGAVLVSAKTGAGLDALLQRIVREIESQKRDSRGSDSKSAQTGDGLEGIEFEY
jgi:GTP-binding protein HflX